MNTSALILMLSTIIGVTFTSLYFLIKVLRKKTNFNQDIESNTDDKELN